jgi:hypothetical protein
METIDFYDVKRRKHVEVPVKYCRTEILETSRGKRKRIVGAIRDNPSDPDDERFLSKFCSMDFEL